MSMRTPVERPALWLMRWSLLAAALFCSAPMAQGAVTVKVTQKVPLEMVSPAGDVTGVKEAVVGDSYTFVSFADGQVTVQDSAGLYRLAVSATDYVPPAPAAVTNAAPATTAMPSTNAAPVITPSAASTSAGAASSETASTNAPAAATGSAPDGSTSLSADKVDAINKGLGKPIFSATPFWKESAAKIADRLDLKLEGRTKWETSYRSYFSGDVNDPKASMLGGGLYCIALYADADDHPTSLLLAFANDGDYKQAMYLRMDIFGIDHPSADSRRYFPGKSREELSKEYDDDVASFEPTRKAEAETLQTNLTALFGDPKFATFGSEAATREDIKRWDLNDVSFLLTSQENKYNLLRIVPTTLADNNGRSERIARDEIGAKLSAAVEHRPNGDVVITQIPMADQGPKGFCVPATWERVLRYEGVPGDMYTLSRIGGGMFGGGTFGGNIAQQLDDTLHDYGRHTEFIDMDIIDAVSLRRYIDNGIPVFWSVNTLGYEPVEKRYALANRDKDWDRWKALVAAAAAEESKDQPPLGDNMGHQVLITGYNAETREIAWSDPWGHFTAERWMTMAEAQRSTLGQYYIISW